jgi:uncharacterized protein
MPKPPLPTSNRKLNEAIEAPRLCSTGRLKANSRIETPRSRPAGRLAFLSGCLLLLFPSSCELQRGIADEADPPVETASNGKRPANRLAGESSPYLLLHAHNPVDWYPWGPEALQKAREENKPIFLSIGYSSCFWCHVMERQVFEHEEIAEYMNEHFINVKVDREERPDLDDIYMLSLQVYQQMAGSAAGGGWPLSMFLTPDGLPIAGGTYFPPEDMPGRVGFPTVMKQIHSVWTDRQEQVEQAAEEISRHVRRLSQPQLDLEPPELDDRLVQGVIAAVVERYDPEHGGFDFNPDAPDGPKFPVPSKINLMQTQIAARPPQAEQFAEMVDHTLERMAAGGLRDHLGGGFHRYSVDRYWLVPHFEKMLYDNAQLAEAYVDAYRRTNRQSHRQVAESTLDFILREMTGPEGGFYSALDAETDGIEGKYYVWSRDEMKKLLSAGDYRLFADAYGLSRDEFFEHGYVLHHPRPLEAIAEEHGMPLAELYARLAEMRQKLLEARQKRKPLLKDDKVLTSWNGLMIRAFARAGQTFQRRDYIDAAARAAVFVLATLRDEEGQLLRTARLGEAKLNGYLDDYAFLVSGLLALHQATGEDKWLVTARRLTDDQIRLFWDEKRHGFFFTAHDHEALLARVKSAYDSVLPSGNTVSVQNLVRLSRLTSEESYRKYAEQTLQAFAPNLKTTPGNLHGMALALQEYLHWYGEGETDEGLQDLFTGGLATPRPEPESGNQAPPRTTPDRGADAAPPAETVVSFQPAEEEAKQHDKITVRGFLSTDKLPVGGTCRVAVEIDVAEGWHVNANPARPDFVIPTQLSLQTEQDFELKEIRYPQGKDFRLQGIEEPLSVYEGKVYLTGTLQVPDGLKSDEPIELTLRLRYQACNDTACLRPMQIHLKGTLPAAPRESVQSKNEKLFEAIDRSR